MNDFSFQSVLMTNMIKRLSETTISPEDALDELAELDPETTLGQAMTDIMVMISSLDMLDYYIGYDRQGNTIKMYLSKDSKVESLKALVDRITIEIEKPANVAKEEKSPIIKVKLYRSNMSDDFVWVLMLQVFVDEPEGYSDTPVDIDMQGDVDVVKKEQEKQPASVVSQQPPEEAEQPEEEENENE